MTELSCLTGLSVLVSEKAHEYVYSSSQRQNPPVCKGSTGFLAVALCFSAGSQWDCELDEQRSGWKHPTFFVLFLLCVFIFFQRTGNAAKEGY